MKTGGRPRRARRAALVLSTAALTLAVFAPAVRAQDTARQRGPGRARLEQQFRQRLADVVRQRLALTDSQMVRLEQTNGRIEPQRRKLLQEEREVRQAIRSEVTAGERANQPRVAELIQRAIGIQRRRLDLVEAEQKELAQYMTPVQRARYLNLQEQLRQRVEQLRHQPRGGRRGATRGERPGAP